ncbi:hypothetical protein [Bacillus sp. TE9122W]
MSGYERERLLDNIKRITRITFLAVSIGILMVILGKVTPFFITLTKDVMGYEEREQVSSMRKIQGIVVDKKMNILTDNKVDLMLLPAMNLDRGSIGLALTPVPRTTKERTEFTLRVYAEDKTSTIVVNEKTYHTYKKGDKVSIRMKNNKFELEGE